MYELINTLGSRILKRSKNNVVTIIMFLFMILYVEDQRQLHKLKIEKRPKNIDHKEILRLRNVRLKSVCETLRSPQRVEHSSVLQRPVPSNECTGTFFRVDTERMKHHFICSGLKTGSTSWQAFFTAHNISSTHIRDCLEAGSCPAPAQTGLRIVQVRHPFERLLSSYRHVFQNEGWKTLDTNWQNDKELETFFIGLFSKSWPEFVENIIINNGFFISEDDLDDLDAPGTWIRTHWAPFWFTCDLCSPTMSPEMVIKTETLELDVPEVLERLGLWTNLSFPALRVLGPGWRGVLAEGAASEDYMVKYFSQLTQRQILQLYEVYRMDFIMFGYHPHSFIELLSKEFNANLKNYHLL